MIESIWLEIRPALRCCHFCVVFKEVVKTKVKINVEKSSLLLEIHSQSYKINFPNFIVEPLTMTGFKITNQFCSFRIQCECKFQTEEVLSHTPACTLIGKQRCKFLCKCHNILTSEMTFDRILPLPSNNFNPSDLFCHAPSTGIIANNLIPRLNDCLYTDVFVVVNSELVSGCKKKDRFLKCKRCLSTVGVSEKNSAKFWTDSINLPTNNFSKLEHFKNLVKKSISDGFTLFPKILFECEENNSYFSIEIIDKNLIISNCQENLKLTTFQVVKLKYMFHSEFDSLVKSFKSDLDSFNFVHQFEINQCMLNFIVEFLISSSKNIPPIFSKIDDACMAYLNLSE